MAMAYPRLLQTWPIFAKHEVMSHISRYDERFNLIKKTFSSACDNIFKL